MIGIKRSRSENDLYDHNNNKKQKSDLELSVASPKTKSCLENLPNETIYEIFDYLDSFHIYQSFFSLNTRFDRLILNPTGLLQVNIGTMSKSDFDLYYKHVINPNRRRINYLRLSNPFTSDLIFSPPLSICRFMQLKTLILEQFDSKYMKNVLQHLIQLPKLESLKISFVDLFPLLPAVLFQLIFQLSKLKSCQVTYRTKFDSISPPIYLPRATSTSIESLTINNRFSIESLFDLYRFVPQLRYLSINSLAGYPPFMGFQRESLLLKHLKTLSLKIDDVQFGTFAQLMKSFFSNIEILHLEANHSSYLHLDQWQDLILSSMPNLRIFDFYFNGILHRNEAVDQFMLNNNFDQSFWNGRGWVFVQTEKQQGNLRRIMFYSLNPYRRKDYDLYWEHGSIHPLDDHLSSVEHVHLRSDSGLKNAKKYFPNTTTLTIEHYFQPTRGSLATIVNEILPLKQLKKLVIENIGYPFDEILQLMKLTPNLQFLSVRRINYPFLLLNNMFQMMSLKTLEIHQECSYEYFQIMMMHFPQLNTLRIAMKRPDVPQTIRYVFTQPNHLFSLCFTRIPKVCLRDIKNLIRYEKLIINYTIKLLDHDLYLWW
ncbi:unnamed protein product [Adineta ricciae]|uniref:F-box domain-containing protein n=1 Tax=Adineta ricciae TaxID=249248 RepID=A0A814BAT9_ADIRI|nr:unnamed protein product [Adineta ricciae]CAF1077572.1 unnamed protein product [Adineta ricciae]